MKVFISWSKGLSREVAEALHWWLPQVLQSVEPFLSSADIQPGQRWSSTIAGELEESNFGILCVTRRNRNEPWLNFEAGALAKKLDGSRVVPLLIDLTPADLVGPLSQFQVVKTLDQSGVTAVVRAINGLTEVGLSDARLADAMEGWWPRLEPRLQDARAAVEATAPADEGHLRNERELLEEVLTLVRGLSDDQARATANRAFDAIVEGATGAAWLEVRKNRKREEELMSDLLAAGV